MRKRMSWVAAGSLLFSIVAVIAMKPVVKSEAPPFAPPTADFPLSVGGVGLVESNTENIALSSAVPGLVMAVHVRAGDRVQAAQKLFSLDDREWQAELRVRRTELETARRELDRLASLPRPEDVVPVEAQVSEAEAQLEDARVQLRLMESVTDRRAIRQEELERRRHAFQAAQARAAEARAQLARLEAGAWEKDLAVTRARVALAAAHVQRVETEIERRITRAPVDGVVLQSIVRPGQYAAAGAAGPPMMLLGSVEPLHVRVDVDEHDAARVAPGAPAVASPRGNGSLRIPLEFVRFEPYIVPKRSLTGDSIERVDTRVLQVIYRVVPKDQPLFVGQQVDVLIQAAASSGAASTDRKPEAQ